MFHILISCWFLPAPGRPRTQSSAVQWKWEQLPFQSPPWCAGRYLRQCWLVPRLPQTVGSTSVIHKNGISVNLQCEIINKSSNIMYYTEEVTFQRDEKHYFDWWKLFLVRGTFYMYTAHMVNTRFVFCGQGSILSFILWEKRLMHLFFKH